MDGSVTMVWGFEDEADDYAAAILDRIPDHQAIVPSVWPLEVANALLVGERRKRLTPTDAARFLAILGTFPITVDAETASHAWHETSHLARAHALSADDATDLDLAIRLGLQMATLDDKLKTVATAVGVALFDAREGEKFGGRSIF